MAGKRYYDEDAGSAPTVSKSKTSASKSKDASNPSQSTTTLLISSLPPNYTSDSLSTLLSSVGPIRTAFVVSTRASDNGIPARSKGYGFAKFVLKDDAEKAIQDLNGTLIDGKRIGVEWAKRRMRGEDGKASARPASAAATGAGAGSRQKKDDDIENSEDFVSLATKENVKSAYAARREAKRARTAQDGSGAVAPVDNRKDARTVILEGGLDVSKSEDKKALTNRLKKQVIGINKGDGALQLYDLTVLPSTVNSITTEEHPSVPQPVVHIEAPTPKVAVQLSEKLHNTVIKGHLVLAKVKFENDLVSRKGRKDGDGRLIVRNLGFDVAVEDLASAFAPYGPIHSIQLHKGFAFVWYLRRTSAEEALSKVNGKRIYAGMVQDRIEESAKPMLTSKKRKIEKGKIVGVKGRIVAVDWALGKKEYESMEKGEMVVDQPKDGNEEDDAEDSTDEEEESDDEDDSDLDPVAINEEEDDDDMSPVPEGEDDEDIDEDALEAPEVTSDEEDDDDDDEASKPVEGTTLFVRNIQFEATEDELYNLFKAFGPVKYARIVMDPTTKRSRGTGFVCFYREEDAAKVLEESERLASQTGAHATKSILPNSLLTADPSSTSSSKLTLHSRVLGVSEAVSKSKADKLREDRDKKGKNKDRRNLYLMHEGTILPESPLAALLSSAEVQARQSSFEARRNLLRTNPALYISRTRLAIRQIPLFVNERMLRRLAGWAIKAFNNEVKQGRRTKLTLDELREPEDVLGSKAGKKAAAAADQEAAQEEGMEEGSDEEHDGPEGQTAKKKKKKAFFKQPSKVKQAKILRQDDRVDPLTGQKRSKGYGFLELNSHADALRVVRWANANDEVFNLFRTWWIEDLKSQIERLKGDDGKAASEGTKDGAKPSKASKKSKDSIIVDKESETRLKRLQEKLAELEAEEKRAASASKGPSSASAAAASTKRQGKTLIIEFSIENAMTVKRREEKAEKSRERDRKRKRAAEEEAEQEEHGDGDDDDGDAEQETLMKEQEGNGAKKQERNHFGSMIGKKRKMAKQKKGGKK